jgi:phage-related protein
MDGYVVIGTDLETKSFDAQIDYIKGQLETIEYKLKQADMGFEVGDTQKLEAQYEKLVNQLENLRKKQADLNKTDLTNIQRSIEKIGDATSKTISKVGKWALAVFGVRTAYMFVRNAMSTLSQYNQQIKNDVEYISFATASMLQPVIERLIQLAYTLLNYINYIAKAWFGVNLFANASADAMNKGAKSAEKMKKSMAGFDEMNVISDTSGGGSGNVTPSFDLSAPEDAPIPGWIQWIADNKDLIIATLLGISGALLGIHFGLTLIQGLGIGLILAGVALVIQGIVELIKDPSWNAFLTVLQGIALIVAGIAVLMGGWIVALIALGVAIVAYVIQNWEKVKSILGVVGEWINKNIVTPVANFFVKLWNGIGTGVSNIVQKIKSIFGTIVTFFSNLINNVLNLFKTIGTKVGNIIGSAFKKVVNGVLSGVETILNSPINSINSLIGVINEVPGVNLGTIPTFKLPRLAKGGIVNNPGRGVMMGSYVAGEKGPEAVLPLTDDTLQRLANMIPITINLTNTMNGRVISRELQKVNNSNDFAFNR